MANLVVVGSANMDLMLQLDTLPAPGQTVSLTSLARLPGGKGANAAAAAARLGCTTYFCGQVGADADGQALADSLAACGVDCTALLRDANTPTGLAIIPVEASGQNCIMVYPGANATLQPAALAQHLPQAPLQALLLQLELSDTINLHALRWARQRGLLTVLDAGPAHPIADAYKGLVDVFSPNQTECAFFCGIHPTTPQQAYQAGQLLQQQTDAGVILIKMGAQGAYLYSRQQCIYQPAYTIDAIDPTAAGDCFTAAATMRYLQTGSWPQALSYAAAAGALTSTRLGAQASLPTHQQVQAFIDQAATSQRAPQQQLFS